MSTQLARRERDTAPQADLPHAERQANLRSAFSCRVRLDGMRLAVVDDVMTTGATLNELARTLKRAGAMHIQNWVVARAILN
jgi:predicted amidophosphoribosyltransferase